MVATSDLSSGVERRVGSSPTRDTNSVDKNNKIMANLIFNFKIKPLTTKRKHSSDGVKRVSGICTGLVSVESGKYTVLIFNDDVNSSSGDVKIEFTEKSYNLKERQTIFSRVFNDGDKVTRFVRTKLHARNFPGDPTLYVPFAPNWNVRGYIVEDKGVKKFDFTTLVGVNGYDNIDIASNDYYE